jgi:hypothetical protein
MALQRSKGGNSMPGPPKDVKLPTELAHIKPHSVDFSDRVQNDPTFLSGLLYDPHGTLLKYGYAATPQQIQILNGIANDVLTRARVAFGQLGKAAENVQGAGCGSQMQGGPGPI